MKPLFAQDLQASIAAADEEYAKQKQSTAAEDQEINRVEKSLRDVREEIARVEQKGHAAKSAKAEFFKEKERMRRRSLQLVNAMESAEVNAARVLQDAMLESVELPGACTQHNDDGVFIPDCFRFDFDALPDSMRAATGTARQKNLDQLREEAEQLRSEIDGMSPNLKAPEEYENILQEEKVLKMVEFICLARLHAASLCIILGT